MSKNKIPLELVNLAVSDAESGAYVMLLNEVGGSRRLPIVIGAAEAQSLAVVLRGITPPRPMTHDLFASTLGKLGWRVQSVFIYKSKEGVFFSYINMADGSREISMDARTSDAVALSVRFGSPVFIDEELLNRECLHEEVPQGTAFATVEDARQTAEQLKARMQQAVEEENYELAAAIRNLLKERLEEE